MRARARSLHSLRCAAAESIRDYDDAVNAHLAVRISGDPDGIGGAVEVRVAAAAVMREAMGALLVALHDTPRSASLWRELEQLAPGLAADARQHGRVSG